MEKTILVSPQNSLVILMDFKTGVLPESLGEQLVTFTNTCCAIGTMSEDDGESTITILDENYSELDDDILVNSGSLLSPNNELSLCNVMNEILLSIPTANEVSLKIYVNNESEPDRINIVIINE